MRKWRVGTFTAGILFVVLGVLFTAGNIYNFNAAAVFIRWWPIIIIMLGIELYVYSSGRKADGSRLRFDVTALIMILMTVVICSIAYAISRANFNIDTKSVSLSKYETVVTKDQSIPSAGVQKLLTANCFGDVFIKSSYDSSIKVHSEIHIKNNDESYARKLCDKLITLSSGSQTHITNNYDDMGIDRSKVQSVEANLTIYLPKGIDAEVKNQFGDIKAEGLDKSLRAVTGNGDVDVNSITGDTYIQDVFGKVRTSTLGGAVTVSGKNNEIYVQSVVKDANITNTFGKVEISGVTGNVHINNNNGDIRASDIAGGTDISSQFGDISLMNAAGPVKIANSNGDVDVSLDKPLTGSLNVTNNFGHINIGIPKDQTAMIDAAAEFGDISTNTGLQVIEGTTQESINQSLGDGKGSFVIRSSNGDINLNVK